MTRARRTALWLVPAALLLCSATPTSAADDSRQTASYTLSATEPATATDEHFVFDYRDPADPEGKPPAVTRVVTILPRGAHYDTSVPALCTASDAELMAQGGAACPAQSAIGGGVVTVDTGVPGPDRIVTADVEFFNNTGEFIYLNTIRGTSARTVIRATADRRQTITVPGMLPGTPPDGGAIDTADLTVESVSREVAGRTQNYITTPRGCRGRRDDRHWTTRVQFSYGDGATQTVPTHTPCTTAG